MPKISEFYGIVIVMNFNEHPPPHFHAIYGDAEAWVAIDTLEVTRGTLPPPQLRMVLQWAFAHQSELRDNWERAMRRHILKRIAPEV